tara:strand:- start:62 stop:283 length:222 start_codon:yes stop_codon:yes gene_type:complete
MNKEIAEYLNILLADRQRQLKEREKEFLLMSKDLQDEKSKELNIIYKAHKAMDYFIEEEEEDPLSEFDAASYT